MAMDRIRMVTDTGGGQENAANTSKSPAYTTPSSQAYQQGAQALARRTNTSTASGSSSSGSKSVATQTPASTSTNTGSSGGSGGYSGGYSGGGGGGVYPEEVQRNYDLDRKVLDMLNSLFRNQYTGQRNSADTYRNTANQNISKSQKTWEEMYNQNNANIAALEAENRQREAALRSLIEQTYGNSLANANEYYNNLLGTYNRSMGIANQGYEEGVNTSAQARDEAIALAQALYEMGEATQNRETEKSLKGQYTSYMKGMKNLNQRLAAMGVNGGATETSLLNALNSYEQNRTDLNEAKLAALGALRQTQMQSDSEAQQAYLAAVKDLLSQRTQNYLGIENQRSAGEQSYANMKNEAESQRSNQRLSAENNFQQWASDILGQRTNNNTNWANAVSDLNNQRNNVAQNYQNMYSQALQDRTANYTNPQYQGILDQLAAGGEDYNLNVNTSNTTTKEQTKAVVNGTASYKKAADYVQRAAANSAYKDVINGKKDLNKIADKDLRNAVKKLIEENKKSNKKAAEAAKKYNTGKKKSSYSTSTSANGTTYTKK